MSYGACATSGIWAKTAMCLKSLSLFDLKT
jgi:hypothetical protein